MDIRARDIIQLNDEAIIASFPDSCFHNVAMDDGVVVESTQTEIRYSRLFWEIFNHYPNAPILKQHHVTSILGNDALTTNTHLKLCTNILKTVVSSYGLYLPEQKEPLLALIYQTISDAMGALGIMTEEYVIGLDVLDFVQIAHHPKIKDLRSEAMEAPEKIKYAYEGMLKEIETNSIFDNNGLAKAVRSKMVKLNQVVQCIGFRGFPTEVDGAIYPRPIWSNYTLGNRKFYDMVADSRTAAKAHFYSDSALKDSEYRARKFQLNSVVLEHIVYEDCGSDDLMPWKVQGRRYDTSGTEIYPGDLPMLIGKYYVIDKSDSWRTINGSKEEEAELVGKTIWFRSILGCKHRNPHDVCHVCAGELSQNVSRFANLGHLGSVTISGDFTQNILSIKHVNMSSVILRIFLGDYELKYLNTGAKGEGYFLNKFGKDCKVYLSVLRDEAAGLLDIGKSGVDQTLTQLSLPRISRINTIRLRLVKTIKGVESKEEVVLNVKMKQNVPMMSRELLAYLAKQGWDVDEDNSFVFDMSKWNHDQPILVLQSKEESFVDLADEVKSMIQSSQKLYKKRIEENACKVLLQELFDTVNSKLRINIIAMEALIYGLMTASDKSYAMARNAERPVLGIGDELTMHRSLGPAMAFEGHETTIFEPMYFYQGTRPDNPMDVFLCPQSVIESKYNFY